MISEKSVWSVGQQPGACPSLPPLLRPPPPPLLAQKGKPPALAGRLRASTQPPARPLLSYIQGSTNLLDSFWNPCVARGRTREAGTALAAAASNLTPIGAVSNPHEPGLPTLDPSRPRTPPAPAHASPQPNARRSTQPVTSHRPLSRDSIRRTSCSRRPPRRQLLVCTRQTTC